jgi:hypothetical protein
MTKAKDAITLLSRDRYMALRTTTNPKGNTWGIYDREINRFVPGDEEIDVEAKLSEQHAVEYSI